MTEDAPLRCPVGSKACDVTVSIAAGDPWQISLFGLALRYDPRQMLLTCGDRSAPVAGTSGLVTLRILYDTICAEIFADEGSVFMGMTYIQDSMLNNLTISSRQARVAALRAAELKPYFADKAD